MSIKILHLYHDLMNLYGEIGNVRILDRKLKDQGQDVDITWWTLGDAKGGLGDFDFIYCGAGTEHSRNAAMEDLRPYAGELKAAMEAGVPMLFTGNSFEMLGHSLVDADGVSHGGLGLFDFDVEEQKEKRYTGDVILKSREFDKPFVGFMNRCSKVSDHEDYFFDVEKVIGTIQETREGVRSHNFYGTQLIGPIIGRNPHFSAHLVRLILGAKGIEAKEIPYPYEEDGYEILCAELAKDAKGNE